MTVRYEDIAIRRDQHIRRSIERVGSGARYARLDLRLVDSDETAMWITKVQPINGR